MQQHTAQRTFASRLRSPVGFLLCIFSVLGAAYLTVTHTAHVISRLPYGLILLCPIMHLFMHRGHGGHSGHGNDEQ